MDYTTVPAALWALLAQWYNYDYEFPRKVIMRGFNPIVEMFPQPCEVRVVAADGSFEENGVIVLISRTTTALDFVSTVAKAVGGESTQEQRLWTLVCVAIVPASPLPCLCV